MDIKPNKYKPISPKGEKKPWIPILIILLVVSILLNAYLLAVRLNTKCNDSTDDNTSEITEYNPRAAMKKPIIYLYPPSKEEVNVQLQLKGQITCSYPDYKNNGWTVEASPDGTLFDPIKNRKYSYLYYEGISTIQFDFSKGFVIPGMNTKDFLEDSLEKLGLTDKESEDFITYWLPKMQNNKYNLIHFSENEYEQNCNLVVSPKPDTEIRVSMTFIPLNSPISVNSQKLTSVDRNGFTVVEWGGSELNEKYLHSEK